MTPPPSPLSRQLASLRIGRAWPLVLVLIGCVLVVSLLQVSREHFRFSLEAVRTVQANHAQLYRLDSLLLTMVNAETGIRGYLLTGSPIYLEPYQDSEIRIAPLIAQMERDFPPGHPDRDEFEVLKKLVALKRLHLARALQRGQIESVIPPGETGPGKAYMDQIRLSVAVLHAHRTSTNERLVNESLVRLTDIQHAVTALALGALGLLIVLFGVQQRQARLRVRISELLEHENSRLESTVEQRTRELSDLASYLTNAREEERSRLARELHDELGSLLTAAKMDASWLLRTLGPSSGQDIRERFRRLIEMIGQGITIKRRIIDDLRPPLLQGLGLVEALRALADSFKAEIPVKLELPREDPGLPEDQSLALFRIAQEAFTNLRKYARASQVELGLRVENAEILLWIKDDGVGFDPDSPQISRHGLAGMKHRVQMFQGALTVRSTPGKGSCIEARLPLGIPAPA